MQIFFSKSLCYKELGKNVSDVSVQTCEWCLWRATFYVA